MGHVRDELKNTEMPTPFDVGISAIYYGGVFATDSVGELTQSRKRMGKRRYQRSTDEHSIIDKCVNCV